MKSPLTLIRNGTGIACLTFLMFSCSAPKEKPIPKSHTVEIRAMQFQPAKLLIQKGDTVVFINLDILVHNVTEEKKKAWNSQSLATGDSYKMVPAESTDYYCSLHPVMKGKILVE
jgi:plastocyanin